MVVITIADIVADVRIGFPEEQKLIFNFCSLKATVDISLRIHIYLLKFGFLGVLGHFIVLELSLCQCMYRFPSLTILKPPTGKCRSLCK